MQPINRSSGSSDFNRGETTSFNTYVTLLSNVIVHRWPDFESVNQDEVRRVAEFCVGITDLTLETWNQFSDQRRRTTQRAA